VREAGYTQGKWRTIRERRWEFVAKVTYSTKGRTIETEMVGETLENQPEPLGSAK
jgi:hypothetical protein